MMSLFRISSLLLAGVLFTLTSTVFAQPPAQQPGPSAPSMIQPTSPNDEFVYVGPSCDPLKGSGADPTIPRKLSGDNEIYGQNRAWSAEWIHWLFGYYFCLGAITILSGLAASNIIPDGGRIKYKSLCSLFAAIIAALLGAFSPQARSERIMHAWVYLNTAVLTFENDQRMTMCELVRAYSTAQIIARGTKQ